MAWAALVLGGGGVGGAGAGGAGARRRWCGRRRCRRSRGIARLPHSHGRAADAHVAGACRSRVRRDDEANRCGPGTGRGLRREPGVGRPGSPAASARRGKVQLDRAAASSQVHRHGGHIVAARRGLLGDLDALVFDRDIATTERAVRVRQDGVANARRSLSFGATQGNPRRLGSCGPRAFPRGTHGERPGASRCGRRRTTAGDRNPAPGN